MIVGFGIAALQLQKKGFTVETSWREFVGIREWRMRNGIKYLFILAGACHVLD